MDRQTFRETLRNVLHEILLPEIQETIDQQFQILSQQLRYMSAMDRRYNQQEALKEGLPGILNHLLDAAESADYVSFVDTYLATVDKLAEHFPTEVQWPQQEERFSVQSDDSLLVSVGKRGKKLGRTLSKTWHNVIHLTNGSGTESWSQAVPLRRLVTFHLLNTDLITEWRNQLERLQLEVIIGIEDHILELDSEEQQMQLSTTVELLQSMLESQRVELEQDIENLINSVESDICARADQVGTVELRRSFYDEQRVTSSKENFREQVHKDRKQWQHVQTELIERCQNIGRFLDLQHEIRRERQKFESDLQSVFKEHLDDPLADLMQLLGTSIRNVGQGDVSQNVEQLKEQLGELVSEQLISPLQALLERQIVSSKVERFFEEVLLIGSQTQQQIQLVVDIDLDKTPPVLDDRQIEWRQLVVRLLREQYISELKPEEQNYETFLSEILEEITEIENIIEINLESALAAENEHADQEVEAPVKIVRTALERIIAKVGDLQTRTTAQWSGIQQSITEGEHQLRESLLSLLHQGELKQLQLLNAKYKVQETTKGWKTVIDSRWARAQDRLLLWTRFTWKKAKEYGAKLRLFLGFRRDIIEETKRADIATYLSETDDKLKKLPYIYRRLFDFDAVADERFYVPAQETTTVFKRAYEQWQSSFPASFAVVGEKGSGKSTFLHRVIDTQLPADSVQKIEFHQTIWSVGQLVDVMAPALNIPEAESLQEIIQQINDQPERSIIILEGVQNCFVRKINGYQAIEKLCYLISETREKVFWSVSCSRYAWRFLDKTVQVSEYFSHISTTDSLNSEQIKSVIMNRHRSSGYSLVFEADNATQKSRSFRKLQDRDEEAQEYLQQQYFDELTQLAEGNASVAMIFWIRSIRDFDDTYFYIQPLEITSVAMIEELSPTVLFTLAAFVLQDALTAEDLSEIMHITVEESRLLVNRLRSRGLLIQKEDSFTINHLMYRQILRVLKDRNIIHLV